ncbi:MAG TPA: HAMP domain-containing sensor histidine kinase [Steroidobacteraceae bacterium]|nr:HAMP domain-containing sensor histidine kinase [Steroidobacteraceae bacterium]
MPSLKFILSPTRSVGTRLALGNGAMLAATILLISAVFYFGTVGVLDRSIDGKIDAISNRLVRTYGARPISDLGREINQELNDGIDSDTEIFLVTSPSGHAIVGNLSRWPETSTPRGQLVNREIIRNGKPALARLIIRNLPGGSTLYVGRDLAEQRSIRELVLHALDAAAAVALVLVLIGAYLFRRQLDARIGDIRHTACAIEAGDLKSRIALSGDDEFARLSVDINRMLDRIEQLMNGVRHVSNAIAHDLRTPLSRVRSGLDDALRRDGSRSGLSRAALTAIEGIDDLISVFNKLLQIAEAESGMRTAAFAPVDLQRLVQDMSELYDATAEERGVHLQMVSSGAVCASADRDLLASAVASLIDNAIKYAGSGRRVQLGAYQTAAGPSIVVQDDGPGVPEEALARLPQRFYRMDRARSQPGNGLGLSIVTAIATLHGGCLELSNADPGLRAVIVLPHAAAALRPAEGTRPELAAATPVPALAIADLSDP